MRILLAIAMLGAALMPATTAALADEISQSELVRRTFLGGHVSMLVPRKFRILSAAEIRRQSWWKVPPDAVITYKWPLIDIIFQHTVLPMKPGGLREFLDSLRAAMPKYHPKGRIIRAEMARWAGRSFALFYRELPSRYRVGSKRLDNYTVATVLDGRLLLIAFTSDISQRPVWAATRDRMIRSIRVRE
jgi:hypothetical protein